MEAATFASAASSSAASEVASLQTKLANAEAPLRRQMEEQRQTLAAKEQEVAEAMQRRCGRGESLRHAPDAHGSSSAGRSAMGGFVGATARSRC